ncbi:oxidoreductase [Tepiditoga spiralis]|uniref:Oxidoreductase n=1 Tax=Tepiditoga spiralis TaxID=2108365 RepID=A0A7G1G6J0_9BACT|nr:FAD-dependent oxidoreductase [Tepiditoga spiralis]BBE30966.1 oxidoreductase [Tepiditoga spiralis]
MDVKKSFFAPAKAWKFLTKKPVTIPMKDVLDKPREASDRYRGFHTNDWDKCVGCGTCSRICPAEAINMIEFKELPDEEGSKPERPVFDYGRCTFCGLCVDICTTNSLNMSKEYVHMSPDPEKFFFVPKKDGIHKMEMKEGYTRDDTSELLDLERVEMEHLPAEKRKGSFLEIVKGFSKQQAIDEAARCVECGICTKTCPAHMDIPDYIRDVYNDDLETGLVDLYKTNPLPAVCGRMCTHKCETVCTVGTRGEPVSIRWLKRYIVDSVSPEEYIKILNQETIKKIDGKIAIVGAGPAGLSAAYYLRGLGYEVTVYEAKSRVGGVLNYGGPLYRMPDEAVEQDVNYIKEIGVKILTNTRVGKDIKFEELQNNFDVVFVSTGFTDGRKINLPGEDGEHFMTAMEILEIMKDYSRGIGEKPYIPNKMVVIGGGNVAFDVARTMLRLQNIERGNSEVHVCALETTLEQMPSDWDEKNEGTEEGLHIHPGWGPVEIIRKNGKIEKVKFRKVLSVFDDTGRFNPTYDDSQTMEIEADMVVESVGQVPDYTYLPESLKEKVEMVRGRIKTDENGRVVNLPWLYAGGDIVHGPDIIHGIADGHNAARSIDEYLRSKK